MAKNFNLRGVFMINGYPCATIHSRLKAFKPPHMSIRSFVKHHLLRDILQIRDGQSKG